MDSLPDLPPGFKLDQPTSAPPPLPKGFTLDDDTSATPPLPPGFKLDSQSPPSGVPVASSHANTLLPTPLPSDRVSTYTPPRPSGNVIDTSKPLLTVSDRLNEEMPDTTTLPTGSVRPGVPLYSGANQNPATTADRKSRVATIPLRSAAGLVQEMSRSEERRVGKEGRDR